MPDLWDEAEDAMRSVERQARRDQLEGELEGYRHHLADRTIDGFVWEAMQRGDLIRMTWPGGSVRGSVVAAVDDLAIVTLESRTYAVRLPAVATVEVVESRADSGSTGDRSLGSFVALCRMVEGLPIAIDVIGGGRVDGVLLTTALDHLVLHTEAGAEIAVSLEQVAAVLVPRDFAFAF